MDEHTTKRLQNDLIAWLTTVSRGGQPQTSPVWFLWDDGAIWVYSLPDTARVRNIEANPKVSVNLD
ncbi:MAG: nitroreductase/quinone reductase family protein, partial [Acidimicrobiia bacterium]|nr:nitroreductase/quinone reductase family protein [Acidimicrobiia bacterium]